MKYLILIILLFAFVAHGQDFYGTNDVQTFRNERDKEFRKQSQTPLTDEDFLNFKGLEYFPIDEKFVVKAKLEKTDDTQYFLMPTSVGTSRKFIKYGILKFELDEKNYSLNVYQSESAAKKSEYKDLLFIPFRDLTNGTETYGAGRYLDIKIPSDNEVILNFNLAYNPNCAYGTDKFSCPLPPRENFLQVKIFAGEKKYEYTAKKQ
jgi:uncharacterized protein (DUF1684 family)